jgi:hypothetical protein
MEEKEVKECAEVVWKATEAKKVVTKGRDPAEAVTSPKKVS